MYAGVPMATPNDVTPLPSEVLDALSALSLKDRQRVGALRVGFPLTVRGARSLLAQRLAVLGGGQLVGWRLGRRSLPQFHSWGLYVTARIRSPLGGREVGVSGCAPSGIRHDAPAKLR